MNTDTQHLKDIRVMLVDDSAVIRGMLTKMLGSDPDIRIVSAVADGSLAISTIKSMAPDVLLLDIEMPIMDGLTALPKLLLASPETKIIMVSSLTEKGAAITLKALSLGATECIAKPSTSNDGDALSAFEAQLIRTIKGIVPRSEEPAPVTGAKPVAQVASKKPAEEYTLLNDPLAYKGKPKVIAIGSSTGGPNALFEVTKHMSGFDMPIVITQHMPATFTKVLAQHVATYSGMPACEAEEGMILENGHIYVAPGGFHMVFTLESGRLVAHLDEGPDENFCKPSVDPMVRSLVDIYGQQVFGIILTGMGHDGRDSMKSLAEKGGRVIAQDEETSVVWGMPGAVAKAGICSKVLPIKEIGPWVRKAILNV